MRRLDQVLSRVAERGDPLGADLLIDQLEHKLAGEPDPIVVARQRSRTMQTYKERTVQRPAPPTRRKGLLVALAAFAVVLIAGGGLLMWASPGDNGSEVASPAPTTEVPTTLAPSGIVGEAVGTFTFEGATWSYDGPTTLEAGPVTFSLVNATSERVAVFSFFGLDGEELEEQLAASPVGTDLGTSFLAPPAPPSDFLWLVEAAPGETVSATTVLGAGEHLIDAATMTAGAADHLWRVALIEVTRP